MTKAKQVSLAGAVLALGGLFSLFSVGAPASAISTSPAATSDLATSPADSSAVSSVNSNSASQSPTKSTVGSSSTNSAANSSSTNSSSVASSSTTVTNADIQELTDSIQDLEAKLEILIETMNAQNATADDSYTSALGATESSSHLQSEAFTKITYGIVAGVAVILAVACTMLATIHGKNKKQTVADAVDEIVARNQQIYGIPTSPTK